VSAVQAFLADCRLRNLQPTTITQKRRVLARLERAADPPTATTDELREFLGRPIQPESRATELAHLRTFYRWMVLNGRRGDDPTLPIPRPKVPRRLPRPIPEGDLAVAVASAGARVRPMLVLAGWAGLRAKEIAGLRGEHIQWHLAPPVLVVEEQKGGDTASVPLGPFVVETMAGLRDGWAFPRLDGRDAPVPPHMVSKLCNDHLHSLGISHTLHSLRHRFLTQAYLASGRDLRLTQELARHRSPVSTALYTWVDRDEAAAVVAAIPVGN